MCHKLQEVFLTMTRRIVFTALALLSMAAVANAGIVDPANSWATIQNPPAIILTAPGGGDSFVFPNNHLIDVYVNDAGYNPVEILAVDIWLENDGTEPCPGGWTADSSTYAPDPGHTTFSYAPRGGVGLGDFCRIEGTRVIAVGHVIEDLGLDLRFVSPDLNGDGTVGLTDFAVFATFFNLPCTDNAWCADLDKSDDTPPAACVTLTDFAIFATYFNASNC
jgi:hypothetical protein